MYPSPNVVWTRTKLPLMFKSGDFTLQIVSAPNIGQVYVVTVGNLQAWCDNMEVVNNFIEQQEYDGLAIAKYR